MAFITVSVVEKNAGSVMELFGLCGYNGAGVLQRSAS